MNFRRTASDIEPAWQDTTRAYAAVDTGRHRRVDRREPRKDLSL